MGQSCYGHPQGLKYSKQRFGAFTAIDRTAAFGANANEARIKVINVGGVLYCGRLGSALSSTKTCIVTRSLDGGLTWSDLVTLRPGSTTGDGISVIAYVNGNFFVYGDSQTFFGPSLLSLSNRTAFVGSFQWDINDCVLWDPGSSSYITPNSSGLTVFDSSVTTRTSVTLTSYSGSGLTFWQAQHLATNGHGLFVTCGSYDTIMKSTTPTVASSWVPTGPVNTSHSNFGMIRIAYGNGMWIAVGESGLWSSPDATAWTQRITSAGGIIRSVEFIDNMFVAMAGTGQIYMSRDGVTWVNPGSFGYTDATNTFGWHLLKYPGN